MSPTPRSFRSPVASLPPPAPHKLIHHEVPLSDLPLEDAGFYRRDQERSLQFISYEKARRHEFDQETGLKVWVGCMDEREQDVETWLGIAPGGANVLNIAGCKMGEMNLGSHLYIQGKIEQAASQDKPVLLVFCTHESASNPGTDSCAAWGHDSVRANEYVRQLVRRYNDHYVDRDLASGRIVRRHLVAFHVISYTDTESRAWCTDAGPAIDPGAFARTHTSPQVLEQSIYRCFENAYPESDLRFDGFSAETRRGILRQASRLCLNNALNIRKMHEDSDREIVPKRGHAGTRILVGSGWDMYSEVGEWFKVGLRAAPTDVKEQVRTAVKYLVRNALLKGRLPLAIPIHVNVLYSLRKPASRSGEIFLAMQMAAMIKNYLLLIAQRGPSREKFDEEVELALKAEGSSWVLLSKELKDAYADHLMRDLRIYVSVSSRETRALELVATTDDLDHY